jgi:hypothetical protein
VARHHPARVSQHFIGQAERGEPVGMIGLGESAPGAGDLLLGRIRADSEDQSSIFRVEATRHFRAALGWTRLGRRIGVDARNFRLQDESDAAFLGLDFDKGRFVVERLTQSAMVWREDRSGFAFARAHF